ncbi:MAG: universal stress protein [Phycisphaerales bacterium]
MDKLESILVGVDFTPCSASALRQAVRLSQWNRSSVRAIHVIDTLVVIDLQEALSEFQNDIQQGLLSDARRAWEKLAPVEAAKAGVELDVVIGNEAQSILKAVDDLKVDLLVMGIHGTGSQCQETGHRPGSGIGELAKACVRSAECRVLLTDDTHPGAFKNIVVGVDFSPTSIRALETAFRIAAQDDAVLHVVHVFAPPWRRLHYFTSAPEASPEFQEKYSTALMGRLEGIVTELGAVATYLKPRFHLVEHGSDGRGLIEFVTREKADLLVMGTRGRTGFAHVLGSTAERVLRYAPCSMLTVRAIPS